MRYIMKAKIIKSATPDVPSATPVFAGNISPSVDFKLLAAASKKNGYHMACIATKVYLSAPSFNLVGDENADNIKKALEQQHYQLFQATFLNTLQRIIQDYVIFGNAFFGIIRAKNKKVLSIFHIPAIMCSLESKDNMLILKQQYIGKKQTYYPFNSKEGLKGLEYIHVKNYDVENPYYGTPDYVGAIPAISLDENSKQYNIANFNNNGIPAAVISHYGGDLDNATKDEIKDFFNNEFKGIENQGRVLLLTTDNPEEKIDIKTFDKEKEASYRGLRNDNRDEILAAHRVPSSLLIKVAGSLGNKEKDDIKIFMRTVVEPIQESIENPLNYLILPAMGYENYKIELGELDFDSAADNSEFFTKMISSNVLDPEEVRAELGYPPRSTENSNVAKLANTLENIKKSIINGV